MKKIADGIGVLDTSIATENTGDRIIMEACDDWLGRIFYDRSWLTFPTHERLSKHSHRLQKGLEFNIACGTNLLHSHMGLIKQWNLTIRDVSKLKPVVLFGVGWRSQEKRRTDMYTKWILRRLLSKELIHSVRDSYAKQQLEETGITNVVNTGCPTTWNLTADHCQEIPVTKGECAVVVLTDYSRADGDRDLLRLVCENYKKVYFWCQGVADYNYLKELGFLSRVEVIAPNLRAYKALLADQSLSLDYVGTRLHGGICALQHKRRSIIVGVDHRANIMGGDLNLPVVSRYSNKGELDNMVVNDFVTDVQLPVREIQLWQSQFGTES